MFGDASATMRPGKPSDDEELDLWLALESDASGEVRRQLFERYQPLAKRIAWRFVRDGSAASLEISELIQLASVGLLEAIDHYRPELEVPFRYYCPRRISGAISDGAARMTEVSQQISTVRRIHRERARSLAQEQEVPRNLSDKLDALGEIAAELALGLMLEGAALVREDDADTAPDAYETLAWKRLLDQLRAVLVTLPERERRIIAWHYLDGLPFDTIAKLLGVTKGRISQMHKAALVLLRKRLSSGGQTRLEG